MTTIWVKNNEITAFCDNEIDFEFPEEYGEKQEIDAAAVIIGGKIYIEGSPEAESAQKAYDDMFKPEGELSENVSV